MNRGYFGIGVYHSKTEVNIGTLWRHAQLYGADFIFTIGRRYSPQASDTLKAYRHMPLFNYIDFAEFYDKLPYAAQLVCIEMDEKAKPLTEVNHPQQAVYLLGAEDHGLPKTVLEGHQTIQIPSLEPISMNVAVAGTLVMYDRYVKSISTLGGDHL